MLKLPNYPDPFGRIDPSWNGLIYSLFAIIFYYKNEIYICLVSVICAVISAVLANVISQRLFYVNDALYTIWMIFVAGALIEHHLSRIGIPALIFIPVYVAMRIVRERSSKVKTYQWIWPFNRS